MRSNSLAITGTALAVLLLLPGATMAGATTAKGCPKGHKIMMVHGKLVKCAPIKGKPKPKPSMSKMPTRSASATPSAGATPPLGSLVTITGYAFSKVSVKAGSTVTVRNTSGVEHTLTIATANIDVDVPGGGGTATFTAPTEPGSYVLSCDFHPSMKGTLVVVA